jgi:hypothetical protein
MPLTLNIKSVDYSGRKPKITILGEFVISGQREFVFGRNNETQFFIPSINRYSFLKPSEGIFSVSNAGCTFEDKSSCGIFLRKKFAFVFWNPVREIMFKKEEKTKIERGDLIVIKEKPTVKKRSGVEIIIEVVSA